MKLEKSTLGPWLLRLLVLAAVALMIISFTRPWWVGTFGISEKINIYGWGLRHNLNLLASYVEADVTPTWQVALAWAYVGASALLAFSGTWIKKWWGSLLPAIAGLGFIAYAAVAVNVVISNRLAESNITLEGETMFVGGLFLNTQLQSGYYLAYIAGGLMIVAALLWVLTRKITHNIVEADRFTV